LACGFSSGFALHHPQPEVLFKRVDVGVAVKQRVAVCQASGRDDGNQEQCAQPKFNRFTLGLEPSQAQGVRQQFVVNDDGCAHGNGGEARPSRSPAEREEKRRAAPDLGFGPDVTTVALDDAAHGCQTHAVAGEVAVAVQALEQSKQTVG
jgi:hypothetical protein